MMLKRLSILQDAQIVVRALRPSVRWSHSSPTLPYAAEAKSAAEKVPVESPLGGSVYELGDDAVSVKVNGKTVTVPPGVTVLQACEVAGVHVPRFCFHDRLSIAGNCRMCLVEVVKAKKPVASCAMPIMPNMEIKTDTPIVKDARENVMEFLLANHPLDCPICDQGGECDLQDQSMAFGQWHGRYRYAKRVVEDKDLGPFVKTVMTRCIHCTRCVRYATEICGNFSLGTLGRGHLTEIGTYIDNYFDSELSGNVIDLCPVGALTNRPAAFTSRPWEVKAIATVDVSDAVGSNMILDTRGTVIIKAKPRLNDVVNEEWISDKARFNIDGLKAQRLDTPLARDRDGNFLQVTWVEALELVAKKLKETPPQNIKALAGDMADAESMVALKDLLNKLNCNNTECRQDGVCTNADLRYNYLMNMTIAGIEEADMIFIVGSNPRMEAAVFNARIRKAQLLNGCEVAYLGNKMDTIYDAQHVGETFSDFIKICEGKHPFSHELAEYEAPVVLIGAAMMNHADNFPIVADAIEKLRQQLPCDILGGPGKQIGFIQTAASRVGGLDIGFVPGPDAEDSNLEFVYLLGADEWDDSKVPENAFVVYQGHHGDKGAMRADVILPSASFAEKSGTYFNMEGRPQRTRAAVGPILLAREDWQIIRALSEHCGETLSYNNLSEVRERLCDLVPHARYTDDVELPELLVPARPNGGKIQEEVIGKKFTNFFQTCPITRASKNMAVGGEQLVKSRNSWL